MSGITIVVKGANGSGRTQIADVIRQALADKGFHDVSVVPNDKSDIHANQTPFRETPIIIAEIEHATRA